MRFFLGTHQPHWLSRCRVPLFISRRALARYAKLPAVATDFALDSGGFTELQLHGRWTVTATEYADEVRHYLRTYGWRLLWVAPQDWMCEPIVISGGAAARGVHFAGTGLSIQEHQRRTVSNFIELRRLLGDKVIPVLQGWAISDYHRCLQMYEDAGIRLVDEAIVGVGTVCRRQKTEEATEIMSSLAAEGLRLHGFGFKKGGIKNCHKFMVGADSTAWSDRARREPICLPGHSRPGPGRPRGHKNCANCLEWALIWRKQVLKEIGEA